MATIREMHERKLEKYNTHTDVEATYSVIAEPDGSNTLQIDTYGSKQRKMLGKVSQSIRFSELALKQLMSIIKANFNLS